MKMNKWIPIFLLITLLISGLGAAAEEEWFWDFNTYVPLPEGLAYNNKSVGTVSGPGASGEADDLSFAWLAGIGVGRQTEIHRYTEGIHYNAFSESGTVGNDRELIVNMDLMTQVDNMCAHAINLRFGAYHNFGEYVKIEDGYFWFNDQQIGEFKPNVWYNLGCAYNLSSTNGLTVDVYINGVAVLEGYRDANFKENVTFLSTLVAPKVSDEEYAARPRYDERKEFLYIDNVYIGGDRERLVPRLFVTGAAPESPAAVDSEFSVSFSEPIDAESVSAKILGSEEVPCEISLSQDGKTIVLKPENNLFFSTDYRLEISKSLTSANGNKTLGSNYVYTFSTQSDYPVVLSKVEPSGAQATVLLKNLQGEMIEFQLYGVVLEDGEVKEIKQWQSYLRPDEEVEEIFTFKEEIGEKEWKIFAVDSNGNMLCAPVCYSGGTLLPNDTYDGSDFGLTVTEIKKENRTITITGETTGRGEFLYCSLGDEYKNIFPMGEPFTITLNLDPASGGGEYPMYLKCRKIPQAVEELISYFMDAGKEIQSFRLGNNDCLVGDGSVTLTVDSDVDVSGFLASFVLSSDKAVLTSNGQELVSGYTRLNCTKPVSLLVTAEDLSTKEYTLTVTKRSASNVSSGGGSARGGNTSKNTSVVSLPPAQVVQPTPIETEPKQREFQDVPNQHWAHQCIVELTERGVLNGVSEELFAPEEPMTRGMLMTVLYRMADGSGEAKSIYQDVPEDQWYTAPITWASEIGIAKGMGGGLFLPDEAVTREQIAVVLYQYTNFLGGDIEEKAELSGFGDYGQVSEWARDAVAWAVEQKLMQGDGENLNPGSFATRAEVAAILARCVKE